MSTESNSHPEVSALRNQIFIQLIALVIIAGTLTVYLYRQASLTRKQITQVEQSLNTYKQMQPAIETFVNGLVAFGEKHPDFTQQVLKKYGIEPVAGHPAAAPAPKK